MRLLLITGELAKDYVYKYASKSGIDFDLLVVPFPVASLLSPEMIIKNIRKIDISKFNLILIPGMTRWNTERIEGKIGIPTYKGPKDAADLPIVTEYIRKGFNLSHEKPACELINERTYRDVLEEFNRYLKKNINLALREKPIKLHNIYLHKKLPIKVVAEIIDAPKLSRNELIRKAVYYRESGADIIDIGMIAGVDNSERIEEIINILRKAVDIPLSIDTIKISEVEAAVNAGIDMIISLDGRAIKTLHDIVKDKVSVIIPYDYEEKYFPKDIDERIRGMERNLDLANKYDIRNILCDLIIDPIHTPSLVNSIISFYNFSVRHPDTQLFMGIGNISELIDADSPGVNSLAVAIASELNVSAVLTTEASDKTSGSIKEVSTAVKMMYVSKMRGMYPKDMGISLLCLKEKRRKRFEYKIDDLEIIEAREKPLTTRDKLGFFKIWIKWDERRICVMHFKREDLKRADAIICGDNSSDIYRTIIERGLLSEYTHAAYLGKELEKAELALKLDRSYAQDEDLFNF